MVTETKRGAIPAREDCVLSAMLDRRADEFPHKECVVFEDGPTWTYKDTQAQGRQLAAALSAIGVNHGDLVLVWLPNGPEIVAIALGLSYLGAIFVPVNLALRGNTLEHIVTNSRAKLLVCHSTLIPRLEAISTGLLETVVVVGGQSKCDLPMRILGEAALVARDSDFQLSKYPVEPWDTNAIFYTSGTTGPAKGVICPHLHTHVMAVSDFGFVTSEDRFLINLPLFHIAGAVVPYIVFDRGASMAVLKEFRGRDFWTQVRNTRSTTCMFLGTMADFLLKQPQRPDDAAHSLRAALLQPVVHDAPAFSRRFGITIYTAFDMTETGPAIISGALPRNKTVEKGYCGRLRTDSPHFDLRLVDEHDREVVDGEAGELILRCDTPWVITPGYHGMPEATAIAWRNGWFHTGDILRRDANGNFFFVDRQKDCIRRRGENISSTDVEAELLAYGPIEVAAAVGISGEGGEEEVLVAIQPRAGQRIDVVDLINFLIPRMPHFMVPRFVRIMQELPKTATGKVQKSALRAEGLTLETWDRETVGIKVKRERT